MRWWDGITDSMDMSLSELWEIGSSNSVLCNTLEECKVGGSFKR